ncbi:NUDIX hydrolase 6-like protein [Tanacetum coccineum]
MKFLTIGVSMSSSSSSDENNNITLNTAYPLPSDTAYPVLCPIQRQFLKELRENTFSGSDNEDANEHIEKVLKIVDLFHVPNITVDQLMLRVFPISLTGAASRWLRNEPTGSIKTWEDLKTIFLNKYCPPGRTAKKMEEINNFQQEPDETLYQAWERFKELLMKCPQHYLTEMHEVILFYNGLDVPTRQILDSRGAVPTKTSKNAKKAIQEMAEYSQKWHNGTSRGRSTETTNGLAAIQIQLNNLGREIKKVNEKVYAAQVRDIEQLFQDAAIRNQGASIKTLEIQIGQMSKVLQERGFGSLPSSTETNPRDQVKLISTTIGADSNSIRRIRSNQYAISTGQNSTLLYKSRQMTVPFPSRLDNHYCEEEGNYGPKFMEAYKASHINNAIPQKEKDPGSFTLPCFINDFCFDNALVDLGASISVMPLSRPTLT